jgi:hypothetical protein
MKTKLNVQHEYVTLRIDLDSTTRVNLTTSYGGTKATARGAIDGPTLRSIFASFNRLEKLVGTGKTYATIGDMMEGARAAAEKSANFSEFVEALNRIK